MKIESVCQSLRAYLSKYAAAQILMPLAAPALYVCGALFVLNGLVSLGTVITAAAFLAGVVMMVLTLAQCQFFALAVGLGLYALNYAIHFVRSVLLFRYVAYASLLYLLFYGVLAWLAYRKALSLR